jgi:hypothetical protein
MVEEDAEAVFAAAQHGFPALGLRVFFPELLHGNAEVIGQAFLFGRRGDDASLALAAVAAHAAVKDGNGHGFSLRGSDFNHKERGLARPGP